jgi:flagellar hook-basal body complex protein FliE
MNLISSSLAQGQIITLARTSPLHMPGIDEQQAAAAAQPQTAESAFGKLFFGALNQVNDLEHTSMNLTQALITDPESVDIHDVTIAMAEANLALSMTRAIMNRAIEAYREITNIR